MSKHMPAGAAPRKVSNHANGIKTTAGLDASGLSQTLQDHVDDIRGLIQCGICIRPLYEPFTLACGHTFCYTCLTSWFGGGRSNKTCPDCRAPVKSQPAPAYLVRTIVQLFTGRAELLEKGETTAEHTHHQREEAERVERDKKNEDPREGGLFRGTFNKSRHPLPPPIVDLEDNVVRCPVCSWELEEGSGCSQCGYREDDDSLSDESDSLDDSEENSEVTDYLGGEDGFEGMDDFDWDDISNGFPAFGLHHALIDLHRRHQFPGHQPPPLLHDPYEWQLRSVSHDSEDEDEDDLDDTDMDSFIDDDEEGHHHHVGDGFSESDRSTVVGGRDYDPPDQFDGPHMPSEITMSNTDDYTSDDSGEGLSTEHDENDDDDDDEDDEPIRPAVNGIRRRQAPSYPVTSSSPVHGIGSSRNPAPSRPQSLSTRHGMSHPRQGPSTGTSLNNAIQVEDDSDEGPVGPVRRARDRGNCRRRVY
ncbi:E3 ubiquitin ligase [Aspergillus nanangensis]|uniref:E3 ubiquitin ligase n=1 Tax=Aspergillus nanangensis TaxID=2582783 RepID=A0AAD4CD05_ASPNN|nr:E3 ubiquitin ligase [Aspergillus nanangensis]